MARRILPRTDSTNAEAFRNARDLTGPTWIVTREQYSGRGRRGRVWEMPAGNFAGTLALPNFGTPRDGALLSFVAALALYDALSAACGPSARLAIKWPNDVLLNGGKVAGILLESAGSGQGSDLLAVGVGVNLAEAPDGSVVEAGALPPVSVRGETGHLVAPEDFLNLLAPAFAAWLGRFQTEGFAPIRAAWLARAARLGETITARTGAISRIGRFEGVADDGSLILITAAGRETIPAADVFFPEG